MGKLTEYQKRDRTKARKLSEKWFNLTQSPKVTEALVQKYFDEEESPTKAGLLLYLHIGKDKWQKMRSDPKFKDSVDYADLRIEDLYEQRLTTPSMTTGAIFGLKNCGWSDRNDIKATLDGHISVEQLLKGTKKKA